LDEVKKIDDGSIAIEKITLKPTKFSVTDTSGRSVRSALANKIAECLIISEDYSLERENGVENKVFFYDSLYEA